MHIIPIDISISASQHDFKFDNGFVMNVYCAADASRVLCPLDRDSIGRTARFNNSHHGYRGVVNQQHTHTIFISYFSHHNYLIWITIRAQNFARPICSGLPHLFYLRLDIMCLTEIGAIFDESAYIYIYTEKGYSPSETSLRIAIIIILSLLYMFAGGTEIFIIIRMKV